MIGIGFGATLSHALCASEVLPATTTGVIFGDSRLAAERSRTALAGVDSQLVPGSGVSVRHLLARGIENWLQVLTYGRFSFPTELNFAQPGDSIAEQLPVIDANLAGAIADGAGFILWLAGRNGVNAGGAQLVADAQSAIGKFKDTGLPVIVIADWPDMAPEGAPDSPFTSTQERWDAMLALRDYYLSLADDPQITVIDGWSIIGVVGPEPRVADGFFSYPLGVLKADWDARRVWDLKTTSGAPTTSGLKQLGVDPLPAGWAYAPANNLLRFSSSFHSPSGPNDEANLLDHELRGWNISGVKVVVNSGTVARIRECVIGHAFTNYYVEAREGATLLLEDCTIDGGRQNVDDVLAAIAFREGCKGHVKRTRIVGMARDNMAIFGGTADDPVLVEDCYLGIGAWLGGNHVPPRPETHHDGISIYSGWCVMDSVLIDWADRPDGWGIAGERLFLLNNYIRMAVIPTENHRLEAVTIRNVIGIGNGDGNSAAIEINNKLTGGVQPAPEVTIENMLWEPGASGLFAPDDPESGIVHPTTMTAVKRLPVVGPQRFPDKGSLLEDRLHTKATGAYAIARAVRPILAGWSSKVPPLPAPAIALPPLGTTGGNASGGTSGSVPAGWISAGSNITGLAVTGSVDTITVDGETADAHRSVVTGTAGVNSLVRFLEYQGAETLPEDTPLQLWADFDVTRIEGATSFYMALQNGFGGSFSLWTLGPFSRDGVPSEAFRGRFISPSVTMPAGFKPAIRFAATLRDGATVGIDAKFGNIRLINPAG